MRLGNLSKITDKIIDGVLDTLLSEGSELIDNITKVGGTNAGNPLCCASSIANINFLTDEVFQKDLKKKVKFFEEKLKGLERFSCIDVVNVKGMVAGIIFHEKDEFS